MRPLKLNENKRPYIITDLAVYREADLVVRENTEGKFRVIKAPQAKKEMDALFLDAILDSEILLKLANTYKFKTIVETNEVLVKAHNY